MERQVQLEAKVHNDTQHAPLSYLAVGKAANVLSARTHRTPFTTA